MSEQQLPSGDVSAVVQCAVAQHIHGLDLNRTYAVELIEDILHRLDIQPSPTTIDRFVDAYWKSPS